ncbi:hypothetical protein EZ313_03815 [Ramlibacter henchirensis]|uniref:Bacterial transcriptional activator domain-containing protein n=1 Tax=Ramlibacter henchirensis TaxID=204072 RepID=A0A4Z0C4H5_9BURK|nr:BTAD domain-containing putative transcriptional regulator [Ramlibacter henchirensis]TFZ05794.1 hypothetical protein EZ313_03815 [Ramlibacter henchirensis]
MANAEAVARVVPAKVTRPGGSDVLVRERLFQLLDDPRHPVVWISAPPGSGKTTLASSYIAQHGLTHLWYQLDAGDEDPATFFHYLGLAAKHAAPRMRKPLPALTAEYLAGLPVFARRYFEALASQLKPPVLLVLDNYQDVAPGAPLHALLRDGISALPEGFRTLVLSRTPPPPELSRMLVNERMRLLGWEELRLTVDEVRGFEQLRQRGARQGRSLSSEELHGRTYGWAAGLVLLLEHDVRTAPQGPAGGGHQILFDYFADEIFLRLDARVQKILLAAALLPKMRAQTVAALTGDASSEALLADLHRRNYFTLQHGGAPAYEFHPLFRDFLLGRARATFTPAELADLQRKAAALSEAEGQIEVAAELLREAADWDGLARLALGHAQPLLEQGRSQVLQGWITSLPPDRLAANAWLSYWLGLCRLAFNPAEARGHFERAYDAFKAANDLAGRCVTWCALVDSVVFEWGNFKPLAPLLADMEPLLAHASQLPPPLDAELACGMFLATMYARPQHPDMPLWEQRVREVILRGGNPRLQVKIGNHLILYHTWWIGDLAKAELLVNTLRAQVTAPGVAPLVRITWDAMAAAYYWMSAENAECVACVDHGLQTAQSTGVHLWDMLLCSQGVFATLSSDDAAAGARYLQRMEAGLSNSRPMDQAMYSYLSAWLRVMQGSLPSAREFAETAVAMATQAGAEFPAAVMRIDLGRVRLRQGDAAGALSLVRQARAEGRTMNARTVEYLSLLAEAEIAMHMDNEALCLETLRLGLQVGAAQQFRNQTWWLSSTMARLYAKALEHGIEVPYVTAVIRKRRLAPPANVSGLDRWPWPLQIRTLGEFAVLKDGEPMRFAGKAPRKPLELLKALIAFGGSDVSQELLTDALWPDLEGGHAQQAFETTLYRLRKLFGDEAPFVLKDGRLTLDASAAHVDVRALERLLDTTDEELRGRALAPAELDERLRRLCTLYAGHFLAQESGPWALPLRERLRSRFLRTIEELGRAFEGRQDSTGAVRCYQRGLEVEPTAETLYLRLMCCHQAVGQPAEALAVYRRCRRALSTLLGVPPSRDIEAVVALLNRSAAPSPDP